MKTTRLDIYGFRNKNYDRELQHMQDWRGSKRNKELISLFCTALSVKSGRIRVAKVSSQLRKIADDLGFNLDMISREELQRITGQYNLNSKWSEATKADYRRALHQFYTWFEDYDPRVESEDKNERMQAKAFYKEVKQLKLTYGCVQIDFSEVLSEKDLFDVAEYGCNNIKEKAFLTVLWEAGLRAGEMLNLRIKDVEIGQSEAFLQVIGKTGRRSVPIFKSVGNLGQWLGTHPQRQDTNAYVWLGNNPGFMHEPLKHIGASKLVDRCFKNALKRNPGLHAAKKWHNLHWFRHSRLTVLACEGLNEEQLRLFAGWGSGSNQPKTYVHMNNEQVRDKLRKLYGIKEEDTIEKPTPCSCGLLNDHTARYCKRCGKPLSVVVVETEKEYMRQALAFQRKIFSDPALLARFEAFVSQQNNNNGG